MEIVGYLSGALVFIFAANRTAFYHHSSTNHHRIEQFAIAWWVFIDGVTYARTRPEPLPVAIRFEDWLPGILSTVALIMCVFIDRVPELLSFFVTLIRQLPISVNLIDKDMLNADDSSFGASNVATKARGCAFVGVSMALGALGGAFVSLKTAF